MKIRNKIYMIVAILAVVSMVSFIFVGCKQAAEAVGEAVEEAMEEATEAVEEAAEEVVEAAEEVVEEETEEVAPEEEAGPKMGGSFRIYIHEPVSLDPPNCYESEGIQVARQMWDGLFEYDPDTLETVPAMCDTYDVSDDGLVYTFKLKEGIMFHNGRECTADDFVYSWTRVCLAETASYLAYHLDPILGYDECQAGESDELVGVKAIDDYTLEVTLKYVYPDFVKTLGHVVFYPVAQEEIEQWGEEYTEHASGTGAFALVEWVHDQYITLEKNADYYKGEPYLDEVKYMIYADENTAFLDFQAGNLEYTQIPLGQVKTTQDDPTWGPSVIIKPLLGLYYFGMNLEVEPFKDNPLLREALNYAIDRQNICDVLSEGVSTPATGIVPPGIPGFQENATDVTYDPAKAAQLLADAGYPDGEGLPTLYLGYNTGSSHEIIAEAIQADLAELGVEMEVEGYEWGTMLQKAQDGEIIFYRLGWVADYPTMDNFLFPLFHSESVDNYGRYNNPAVDAALEEARATEDDAERIEKYRAVEKMILDDQAFAVIYFYGIRRIVQPYVMDFNLSNMENYDMSVVWLDQ